MNIKSDMIDIVRKLSGFTLLEVMITLVILSIGLLGLAGLQIVAIRGNAFGGDMSYATALAQQTFEELNNLELDDPALDASINPHTQTVVDARGVSYTLTWNVQDDTPAVDMKSVTVEITRDSSRLGQADQTAAQREVKAAFTTVICR